MATVDEHANWEMEQTGRRDSCREENGFSVTLWWLPSLSHPLGRGPTVPTAHT